MIFYGKLTFMKRKNWMVKQNSHESSVLSLSLIIFLLPFWNVLHLLRQSNISNNVGVTRTTTQKIFINTIFYQFSRDKTKKKGYIQYTLWFADLILFECMCVAIILAHLIWLDLQFSGEVGGVGGSVLCLVRSAPLPPLLPTLLWEAVVSGSWSIYNTVFRSCYCPDT